MSYNRFPRPMGGMYGNQGGMYGNQGGMRPMMGRFQQGGYNPRGGMGPSGLLPTPYQQRGGMMMQRGGMRPRGAGFGPRPRGPRPVRPPGPDKPTEAPATKKEEATEGEPPAKKQDTKVEEKKPEKEKAPEKPESTPVKPEAKKGPSPATPSSQAAGGKTPTPLATSTPTSQTGSPAPKSTPKSLLDVNVKTPTGPPSNTSQSNIPPWKRQHDGNSSLNKSQNNQNKPGGGPPANSGGNTGGGPGGGNRGSFYGRPSRDPEVDVDEPATGDQTAVVFDQYNSDLHFKINDDGLSGESLTKPPGFCFCWGGGRATYGVSKGKICFEVLLSEFLPVDFGDDHQEEHPHVIRVGWSLDSTSFQLGEEPLSYGYGGTGRFSTNNKFTPYGEEFGEGDVILAMVDLEARPPNISYAKNGRWLGVAVPLHRWPVGVKEKALFPHVLSKNCKIEVNFGQRPPWFKAPPSFTFIGNVAINQRVRGLLPPAKKSDCEMIMMCGLPGTGKTTWAVNFVKDHPEKRYNVIGTDSLIDKMKVMGLPRKRNFSGRWDTLISKASACLNKLFEIGGRRKRNLILDQTNVYPNARKRKMKSFEGFQRKVAILVPTDEEMRRRSEKRTREEGKEIPESAVLEMKANFKLPEDSDPFIDEIIWIEQPREAAIPIVEAYNKEGAQKVHPSKVHMQRPDNRNSGRDFRDNRPGNRFDSRPDNRMDTRPDNRMDSRSDSRMDSRSDSRMDSRSDSRMDSRSDNRMDSRSDNRMDSRAGGRNDSHDNRGRSGDRDNRDRGDSRDNRDRSSSRDHGSSGRDHDRDLGHKDGRDLRTDELTDPLGRPITGGDRGRGRGGFDRGGRGGGRGAVRGLMGDRTMDMYQSQESDSGYDSERSQLPFGGDRGAWGAERGGMGRGRGDPGRGGMGESSWGHGRGGDFDSAPWKQQPPESEIEPLFPSAGMGGGRGGRGAGRGGGPGRGSDQAPPWKQRGGFEGEPSKDPPSLLGPPPDKKVKQEPGSGLAFIKQEYDEPSTQQRREPPPSLMGRDWRAGPVKDEPREPSTYDQDQRYGSMAGYGGREGGEGPTGAHPYNARLGEREREPEPSRGPPGRGAQPPPPRGDQQREWGAPESEQNKWGWYDREGESGQGRQDQFYGSQRDPSRPEADSGRDRPYGQSDSDRRYGSQQEDRYGSQDRYPGDRHYGGGARDRDDNRYGQGRPDSYGGREGMDRGYGGIGSEADRDRYGHTPDGRPGDRRHGDSRPGDSRPGDSRPGDRHPGDSRPGDSHLGNRRPGDGRPGDSQYGEQRGRDMYGRDSYGQERQESDRYGRPNAPPGQYGQDPARDRNQPGRGGAADQYGRPGEMDRFGMDRGGRDMYGRQGPPESRDKPADQRRGDFPSSDSRWGAPPKTEDDWRGRGSQWSKPGEEDQYGRKDQSREPPSSQWGGGRQDDYGRGSMPPTHPPGRSSRWGETEKPQADSYQGGEPDPNEPPSTSWMGDDFSQQKEPAYPARDAASKGPSSQQYSQGYGYGRDAAGPGGKEGYGQPKDSDARTPDYYGGRWSDQAPPKDSYNQGAREPPSREPPRQEQPTQQKWDSYGGWGGQADKSYGAGVPSDPASGRPSTASQQPSAWGSSTTGYGDSYGRGQSWTSKPPPPPPPAEKEPPKAPEPDPNSAWSQYGYYGYEDTTAKDPAATSKADAQQNEWADYWRQQDVQSVGAQQAASVESWSTAKSSSAATKSTESKAEPPPPQQTWAWGPAGWQLTSSTTSTTPSVTPSTGGLYQPPPPPPPEDDSQKKRKSRWGADEVEDPKTAATAAYGQPASATGMDAYADQGYGRYDESAYAGYATTKDIYGADAKGYGGESPTKVPQAVAAPPAAVSAYDMDSYMAYTSTAALAVQQMVAQQANPKASAVGAGLMGAYPSDTTQDTTTSTAAEQVKLASAGLAQLPSATGLAAMAGRGMPPQALVGTPVMAPTMSAAAMAPAAMPPGFIGLYQPAAAFGRGAAMGAFRGRMGYPPR